MSKKKESVHSEKGSSLTDSSAVEIADKFIETETNDVPFNDNPESLQDGINTDLKKDLGMDDNTKLETETTPQVSKVLNKPKFKRGTKLIIGLSATLLIVTSTLAGSFYQNSKENESKIIALTKQLDDKKSHVEELQEENKSLRNMYTKELELTTVQLDKVKRDKENLQKKYSKTLDNLDKNGSKVSKYKKLIEEATKSEEKLNKTTSELKEKLNKLKKKKEGLEKKNRNLEDQLALKLEKERITKVANALKVKKEALAVKKEGEKKNSETEVEDISDNNHKESIRDSVVFVDELGVENTLTVSSVRPSVPSDDSLSDYEVVETLSMTATAYVADCKGCSGITATGVDVREETPNIIAVDPSVIPLHSKVAIYQGGKLKGIYTAEDTGGAIKGNIIDILVPTLKEALNWGRRNVTVEILK